MNYKDVDKIIIFQIILVSYKLYSSQKYFKNELQ